MPRELFATGTPWEPIVGYSRAVRAGAHVFVSGTTATDEAGVIVGRLDAAVQTKQTLANIKRALVDDGFGGGIGSQAPGRNIKGAIGLQF